jgi:hypothetical protein
MKRIQFLAGAVVGLAFVALAIIHSEMISTCCKCA